MALVLPAWGCSGKVVPASQPAPTISRVLIVSIDGLRSDLLIRAETPTIHDLIRNGSFTFWARTVDEGYTVPSHVSMLTGVIPNRHGVTWDHYIEDAYPKVPTLFEVAKTAGYTTALAAGKAKLIVLTKPGTVDWKFVGDEDRDDDLAIARQASALLRAHHPDVLFVHLGRVDVVGHASGWGSDAQVQAVATADRALAAILLTLSDLALRRSTLVILTADHGGAGLLHPPEDTRSQFIPWVAAGPGVRHHFDLTAVPDLTVRTVDTFATACAVLGIPIDPSIAGRPVLQMLEAPVRNLTQRKGG